MNKEEQKFTRLKNVIRLSKRLKKYRLRMVAAIAAGVGNQLSMVAASVLGAWTVGLAIDGKLMQKLNYVIAATIAVIIIRIVFYVLEMWICHDVAFKVLADFRIQLFDSIERVSPAILLNMRSGQLASTLMGDVEIMEWFFAHTFGSVLVAIITPVILMIILWQILGEVNLNSEKSLTPEFRKKLRYLSSFVGLIPSLFVGLIPLVLRYSEIPQKFSTPLCALNPL